MKRFMAILFDLKIKMCLNIRSALIQTVLFGFFIERNHQAVIKRDRYEENGEKEIHNQSKQESTCFWIKHAYKKRKGNYD